MSAEEYRGLEGYRRMMAEVRESIYEQFPEIKGHIELFNPLGNPEEEIRRASEALGIPDLLAQIRAGDDRLSGFPHMSPAVAGVDIPLKRPDGTRVHLLVSNPNTAEQATPADIEEHAYVILHEFHHALLNIDFQALRERVDPLTFDKKIRFSESSANAFATDVIARNGGGVGYLYAKAAESDQGNVLYRSENLRAYQGENAYDAGDELRDIASQHYHGQSRTVSQPLTSYRLTGLRDSNERVARVFEASAENKPALAYFQKADGMAIRVAITAMSGRAPEEIRDWINQRPQIFYGVPQQLAAQAYLRDETIARYETVPAQVTTLEQATGRAMRGMEKAARISNPLVDAFLKKFEHPELPIPADVQAEIFNRLLPKKESVSVPYPTTDEERWSFILEKSIPVLEMDDTAGTGVLYFVGRLLGDGRITPETQTAQVLWQKLVSTDNPALGKDKGLSVSEAAAAFFRLPQATIEELAAGKPIEQLMPQVKALLVTREFSEIAGKPVYLAQAPQTYFAASNRMTT